MNKPNIIKFSRTAILPILSELISVTGRDAPAYEFFHIKVEDDGIFITSANSNMQMTGFLLIEPNLSQNTQFTLPAKKFTELCKLCNGDTVTLELELNSVDGTKCDRVKFKCGRNRSTLSIIDADTFPLMPFQPIREIELPIEKLIESIQSTSFAMPKDDARYFLNGMKMELADNILRTVTTDGHRLSLSEVTLEPTNDFGERIDLLVPYMAINKIQSFTKGKKGLIKVAFSNSQISVALDGLTLISKLIDGRYPNYNRVIPSPSDLILTFSRSELKELLKRVSIFSNDRFKAARLDIGKDDVSISSKNNDTGEESKEPLEYIKSEKEFELSVGFNINYIIDILNVMKSDEVTMQFIDSSNPILITPTEQTENKMDRYVVMPMRL